MKKILEWLDGKKSILTAVTTGFFGVLMQQGIIGKETGELLMTVGGTLFAIFLRLGVKKSGK